MTKMTFSQLGPFPTLIFDMAKIRSTTCDVDEKKYDDVIIVSSKEHKKKDVQQSAF